MFIISSFSFSQIKTIIFEKHNENTDVYFFNNNLYNVYKLHLEIWVWIDWDLKNNLSLLDSLKYYVFLDIVDLLEFYDAKDKVLTKFIIWADDILNETDIKINYLDQEMINYKINMDSCTSEKNISDEMYSKYLELSDIEQANYYLNESVKLWKCITENRIKFNSQKIIYDNMKKYYLLLSQKNEYLIKNKDKIIKYFDVITKKISKDLFSIQSVLESDLY